MNNDKIVEILRTMAECIEDIEKRTREHRWEDYVDTPIQKKIRDIKYEIEKQKGR